MPAAVWPSFHCRPSTTKTLLPPSLSMRQTPTTLTKDFGSAPTLSSEKSSLTEGRDGGCHGACVHFHTGPPSLVRCRATYGGRQLRHHAMTISSGRPPR